MSSHPTHCRRCGAGPLGIAAPATVHHMGRGLCPDCYVWAACAGCLDEFAPILAVAAVADADPLDRRGPLATADLARLRRAVGLPAVLPSDGAR